MRRGEGQFVACDVGLRNDPKVLGLARRLKIHRLQAVGLVMSWREFVLTKGSGAGVVKGYTRGELAEFLDWPKGPALVLDALRAAGMLATRRSTFIHPFWAETITGHYASQKSTDRDRKAEERELRRQWAQVFPSDPWPGTDPARQRLAAQGGPPDVPGDAPGTVHGQSGDSPEKNGHKASNGPPGPPGAGGGGGGADPRIGLAEWFVEHHPRLKNEGICRKILARMSAAEAAQLRYCLPRQLPRYLSGMTSRAGRGVPFADKYLREGYYLEYKPPKPKAPKAEQLNGRTAHELAVEKAAFVAKQEAFWAKRDQIRQRLKAEGVSRHQLEQAVDLELEKEGQEAPEATS